MPLITQQQKIDVDLLEDSRNLASHLNAAASLANKQVSKFLSLSDTELTDWLNSKGPADVNEIFAAHAELGSSLNTASTIAHTILASSGYGTAPVQVDIRPIGDKLLAQHRTITYIDGVFNVNTVESPAVE